MAICTGTCWERGVEKSLLLASSWMKFSSTSAVSYKLETPCSKGVPHLYHGQILSSDQQELILSSQLPHTAPLGRDRQRRGRDFVKWHWHFEEEAQGTHTSRETKPSRTAIFKASSCSAVNVTDKSALLCANTLQSKCNLGDHEFIPTKEHFTVQTCSARFCPEGEEKKGKMQRGKKIFTPF